MLGVSIAYKNRRQATVIFDADISSNIKIAKNALCRLKVLSAKVNYKSAKL